MDDDEAPRVFTGRLELVAAAAGGFGAWDVVEVASAARIGTVELAAPDGGGTVACAYAIAEKWQKKGYATEAIGGLIDWAFAQASVCAIRARASTPLSLRVLADNGLSPIGDGWLELRRPS